MVYLSAQSGEPALLLEPDPVERRAGAAVLSRLGFRVRAAPDLATAARAAASPADLAAVSLALVAPPTPTADRTPGSAGLSAGDRDGRGGEGGIGDSLDTPIAVDPAFFGGLRAACPGAAVVLMLAAGVDLPTGVTESSLRKMGCSGIIRVGGLVCLM